MGLEECPAGERARNRVHEASSRQRVVHQVAPFIKWHGHDLLRNVSGRDFLTLGASAARSHSQGQRNPQLLDPEGPFNKSMDRNNHGDPLPYTPPPDGLFPDVRE
jgi:hypothetical protein